ncbi:MAG: VCBS repeat-containing protein, partial [Planctomycetota bacterium]
INGDGAVDVLAIQRAPTARLITLLNNGDGTFADATFQTFNATGVLSDIRTADINDDGVLDLIGRTAVIRFGSSYNAVWLEGNGDGTFSDPNVISPAGSDGNASRGKVLRPYDVGDLNDDGHVDFAMLDSAGVTVFHNDGDGQFTQANQFRSVSTRTDDWMRIADFNGDGLQDILHMNTWNERFELYEGTGDGINFNHRTVATVDTNGGNASGGFQPTDIDNDGDLDIVFGDSSSNQTSTFIGINDGDGNFQISEVPVLDFSDDISPNQSSTIVRGAMFGEYNNDGVVDLSYFTQSGDYDGVGIRLGTRPGEFGTTRSIPWVDTTRSEVALPLDFDGDGDLDLVDTINDRSFENLGDGTFDNPIPASGQRGGSPAAATSDFNLDGLPDFVAQGGPGYYVGISNGDGTFTISDTGDDQTFYSFVNMGVADFNNDGLPDFYTKNAIDALIDVYLNDAADPGTFDRSLRYQLPGGSNGVNVSQWDSAYDVGDFTGDGIVDIATAERDASGDNVIKVVVLAGNGDGTFTRFSELAGFDESLQAGILGSRVEPGDFIGGDIDGDGDRDLMSATSLGTRVFLNDGTGNFTFERLLRTTGTDQRARESYLVDFDEDGHLDLFQTGQNSSGPLTVWLGDGKGGFTLSESISVLGSISSPSATPFVDIDGDGHLDFVVTTEGNGNYDRDDVSIYAGRRDDLVDMFSVDLNGDGNEEILAVQEQMDRLQIFTGDNLDGLTRQPDLQTGRAPQSIAVGDLGADGQPELFTANRASRTISVFVGDLENGYTQTEIPVGVAPVDIEIGDVNNDGHADVVVLDDAENALWVLVGDGNGTLAAPAAIPLGDLPGRFILDDVDADGNVDAVVTLPETNRLMIQPSIGFEPAAPPAYIGLAGAGGES